MKSAKLYRHAEKNTPQFRVVHVIPYDGIGGVEIAAKSLPAGDHGCIRFGKCFLVRKDRVKVGDGEYHGRCKSEDDLRAYLSAARWVVRQCPDLIIASLWRSCAVAVLVKILRPRIQLVTFLHSDRSAHFLDRVLNGLSLRLSREIWGDSEATLNSRVPAQLRSRGRVISMRTFSSGELKVKAAHPHFVFWGRLHSQKGLVRALQLFSRIYERYPEAHFDIVGPDGGERFNLERTVSELGLANAVFFWGAKSQLEALEVGRQSSFYLQTSEVEGLGMSVIEAMQLGLVPVVTPVGEIARYCRDNANAILVRSDEKAVEDIKAILANPKEYERLSNEAAKIVNDAALYKDDVLMACRAIAKGDG